MENLSLKEGVLHVPGHADINISDTGAAGGSLLRVDAHWHDELETVIANSDGTVIMDGKSYDYSKGDIIIVPPGMLHGYAEHTSGVYRLYMVRIQNFCAGDAAADVLIRRFCGGAAARIFRRGDIAYAECRDTLSRAELAFKGGRPLASRSAVYDLLNLIVESGSGEAPPADGRAETIKRAVAYYQNNYMNEISIGDICKYLNISKFYFIRIFKDYCGQTPAQYLISLRLSRALRFLSEGASVTDAALDSGFAGISYFIKKFKNKYGCTPKAAVKRGAVR